jgi:hypothetical protein
MNIHGFMQVVAISEDLTNMHLNHDTYDVWTWTRNGNGSFTSKSVYMAHYTFTTQCDMATEIWRSWEPLRCKIAVWLFVREHVWTTNRLAKRGLLHNKRRVFGNNVNRMRSGQHRLENDVGGFIEAITVGNLSLKLWWQQGSS